MLKHRLFLKPQRVRWKLVLMFEEVHWKEENFIVVVVVVERVNRKSSCFCEAKSSRGHFPSFFVVRKNLQSFNERRTLSMKLSVFQAVTKERTNCEVVNNNTETAILRLWTNRPQGSPILCSFDFLWFCSNFHSISQSNINRQTEIWLWTANFF